MNSQATQPAPDDPIDSPILKFQIEGIRESAKRTRLAFLASIIASLCIFVAEYNAYLSWYFWRISLTKDAEKGKLFDQILPGLYAQNTVINISWLGIRIGEGDLVVLGSLALLAFSIWLYFAMKTYNDLITRLVEKTQSSSSEVKEWIFHGIYPYLLFTTATLYAAVPAGKSSGGGRRMTVKVLYLLPASAVFFVLLTDVLSLFWWPAPFACDGCKLRGHLGFGLQIAAGIFLGLGLAILGLIGYTSKKIIGLDHSTASNIRSYASQFAGSPRSS
jgi:hypothetical protein